jgi:hypothetical protein
MALFPVNRLLMYGSELFFRVLIIGHLHLQDVQDVRWGGSGKIARDSHGQ